MSDPTNVPSFDETGATVSGNGENQDVDIESGNLGEDPDLGASDAGGTDEDARADTENGALSPGSTATGDPTARD